MSSNSRSKASNSNSTSDLIADKPIARATSKVVRSTGVNAPVQRLAVTKAESIARINAAHQAKKDTYTPAEIAGQEYRRAKIAARRAGVNVDDESDEHNEETPVTKVEVVTQKSVAPKSAIPKKATGMRSKATGDVIVGKAVVKPPPVDVQSIVNSLVNITDTDDDEDPYADEVDEVVEDSVVDELTENEIALGALYGPMKQLQTFLVGYKMPKFTTTDIATTVATLVIVDGNMLIKSDGDGYLYDTTKGLWYYCKIDTMRNEFETILAKFLNGLHALQPTINGQCIDEDEYVSLINTAKKYSTSDSFGPRLYGRLRRSEPLRIWREKIDNLDQTVNLFPYGKWVINPKTNVIRKRVKEDYFTRTVTKAKMVKAVKNAVVDKILDQIYCGNRMKKVFHLGSIGLGLCGNASRTIIHLLGGGSNGKSILNDIMSEILGDWFFNTKSCILQPVKRGADEHNANEVGMELARIVRIPEAALGRINENYYKELAGSATRIIRGCGGDRQEVKQNFSVFVDSNEVIKSTSVPVWDRTKIIKFEARFVDSHEYTESTPNLHLKDDELLVVLRNPDNLDYFFTVIMRCAKELHELGKGYFPNFVINDTNEVKGDVDVCQQFIDECIEIDPTHIVTGITLYEAFEAWFDGILKGARKPTMTEFGVSFKAKGFNSYRSNGIKYRGIKLK